MEITDVGAMDIITVSMSDTFVDNAHQTRLFLCSFGSGIVCRTNRIAGIVLHTAEQENTINKVDITAVRYRCRCMLT